MNPSTIPSLPLALPPPRELVASLANWRTAMDYISKLDDERLYDLDQEADRALRYSCGCDPYIAWKTVVKAREEIDSWIIARFRVGIMRKQKERSAKKAALQNAWRNVDTFRELVLRPKLRRAA